MTYHDRYTGNSAYPIIHKLSREEAVVELINAKKINEKIASIDTYRKKLEKLTRK